jgi:hypothetical protein
MTETIVNTSGIAAENARFVKVGALKTENSVTVTLDKNTMYTVAQVIEMAKFSVPESVRTEAGLIESTALLPESCKMIALGITNVKAGADEEIPCEFRRCIKVGALKSDNSKTVTVDKRAMFTVAQIIEKAGFSVPESVRTESGIVDVNSLLPDNCKMIALGLTNVKAGWDDDEEDDDNNDDSDYDDEYSSDDEEDEDEDEDDDRVPSPIKPAVNEDIPCEFRRCIKVGSLKQSNSRTITIDKRVMYTVGMVIEQAGFDVPESVRTESGIIEASALLPESCKMIALGLTNVKAGL